MGSRGAGLGQGLRLLRLDAILTNCTRAITTPNEPNVSDNAGFVPMIESSQKPRAKSAPTVTASAVPIPRYGALSRSTFAKSLNCVSRLGAIPFFFDFGPATNDQIVETDTAKYPSFAGRKTTRATNPRQTE